MNIDNRVFESVAATIRRELRRRLSDEERTTLTRDGEIQLECAGKGVSLAARTRLESPPNAFYAPPGTKKNECLDLRLLFPLNSAPECIERGKRWASDTHASLVDQTRNGQYLPKISIAVSVDEGGRAPKLILKLP